MEHEWNELFYVSHGNTPSDIDLKVATIGTETDIERCRACGMIRVTKEETTYYFWPGVATSLLAKALILCPGSNPVAS